MQPGWYGCPHKTCYTDSKSSCLEFLWMQVFPVNWRHFYRWIICIFLRLPARSSPNSPVPFANYLSIRQMVQVLLLIHEAVEHPCMWFPHHQWMTRAYFSTVVSRFMGSRPTSATCLGIIVSRADILSWASCGSSERLHMLSLFCPILSDCSLPHHAHMLSDHQSSSLQ